MATYADQLSAIGAQVDNVLEGLRSTVGELTAQVFTLEAANFELTAAKAAQAATIVALNAEIARLNAIIGGDPVPDPDPEPDPDPQPDPDVTLSVMDYGAAADGNSATPHDDAPAIKKAFMAAFAAAKDGKSVKLLFPLGKTFYVASSWELPTIRTNDWYGQGSPTVQCKGTVVVSGHGATIKYAKSSTRFCWLQGPNPGALYSTYGNLTIEGLTIDPNFRTTGSECGDVIWIQGDCNVDNITVRDVHMLPNKLYRTTLNQPPSTSGIHITPSHESRNQAHYGYGTNITVEDGTFYGGKPIGIYSANQGTDTTYGLSKFVWDDIDIARCTCDALSRYSSTIHLGSYGAGKRCSVIDCVNLNSSDDGIEIDAFDEVLVQGCGFSGVRQAICFTWFSYPYSSTTPTYTVRDCHYIGDCTPYWPNGVAKPGNRSPLMPEFLDGGRGMNDRDHGHLIIEDCDGEFGVTNTYTIHRGFFQSDSRLASVTIKNCDITDVGSGGPLIVISQRSPGGTLPISINGSRWRDSATGAFKPLPKSKCSFSGAYKLTSDLV